MSDLAELRKNIYPSGWILSKDVCNTPNMCLHTMLKGSTDILRFNVPTISTSNKEEIIKSIKETLKIQKNRKIKGKISWNQLATIKLNITFDYYGTLEIYDDTGCCCISYNPNRKEKLKISGLYGYQENSKEYFFVWVWKNYARTCSVSRNINVDKFNKKLEDIYGLILALIEITNTI